LEGDDNCYFITTQAIEKPENCEVIQEYPYFLNGSSPIYSIQCNKIPSKEDKIKEKEIFEFEEEIKRHYYLKKRLNQILDSLDLNIKKELRLFKRNLEIVKGNLKVIESDLGYLRNLSKKSKNKELKKELSDLESLFSKLENLLKVKSIILMDLYLEFSKELVNKKKAIFSYKKFLDGELDKERTILLLKELYLNFKLLEDFYFSFKIELSQKMEKINNESYLIEKKIEEKLIKLKEKSLIKEKGRLKTLRINKN
jgi:hypothetical protein